MCLAPNLKNGSRSLNPLGQEKFAPRTKMIDHEPRFPAENYQGLADTGLLTLIVSREFGGSGEKLELSAHIYHRVLKVARTISDLAGEEISPPSL